ncbi:hypothetical protein D9M70_622180 [compost metagenome]
MCFKFFFRAETVDTHGPQKMAGALPYLLCCYSLKAGRGERRHPGAEISPGQHPGKNIHHGTQPVTFMAAVFAVTAQW